MNNNDFDIEEDTISLTDEEGRSLVCYVEKSIEVDGREYLLLFPIDAPVQIFAWDDDAEDEDEALFDLEDDEVDEVFDTARAVLAEQNLTLNRSALTLTAKGELPEAQEDDVITLNLDWDDQEPSEESFQILARFFHEEQEYIICTPIDPLPIFAQMDGDEHLKLLEPEEYEMVRSQLEDQLFDDLD